MPITSQWTTDEKTVIYMLYEKPWSWTEFQSAIAQANTLMDAIDHPVDMIIHMKGGLPAELRPWQFRSVFRDFHRNVRTTALVGASDFIRRTISAFLQVMHQEHRNFFFVATLDEAHARFAERESTQQKQLSRVS